MLLSRMRQTEHFSGGGVRLLLLLDPVPHAAADVRVGDAVRGVESHPPVSPPHPLHHLG